MSQVAALAVALALVFGVFAGSSAATKLSTAQKAQIRAELRKQIRQHPGAIRRRAFLRKAALVKFKLPVTIRLRNVCEASQNPTGSTSPGGALLTTQNCAAQGTALNQRSIPSARVNLGPSLGSRDIAISGALAAVVEFQDTYDGGALGNVNLKILPGDKTLTTSSVPLLWNSDITQPGTRSDADWLKSLARPGGASGASLRADRRCPAAGLRRLDDRRRRGWVVRRGSRGRRVQGALLRRALRLRFGRRQRPPGLPGLHPGWQPERRVPADLRRSGQPPEHHRRRRDGQQRLDRPEPLPVPDGVGSGPGTGTAGGLRRRTAARRTRCCAPTR